MKNWILALTGVLLTTAAAAEDIDRRLDAAPDGDVLISNTAGSVEVKGWSRNEVRVTGDLGSNVEELQFEREGDDVIIKVKVPRRNHGGISSDLTVSIPKASSLEIHTVSADIDIEDVEGDQELETVSGDINTFVYGEDIDAGTVSGDIDVRGQGKSTMRAKLHTVSGDIDTDKLSGEIELEAVNGDISTVNGAFEHATLNTVNGEITFRGRIIDDGRLEVETINGEVDVEFDGDVSAKFDIETFNGSIDNCFGPEPVRTSRYTPGRELRFTEGDGKARVAIKTLNGGLRLCK